MPSNNFKCYPPMSKLINTNLELNNSVNSAICWSIQGFFKEPFIWYRNYEFGLEVKTATFICKVFRQNLHWLTAKRTVLILIKSVQGSPKYNIYKKNYDIFIIYFPWDMEVLISAKKTVFEIFPRDRILFLNPLHPVSWKFWFSETILVTSLVERRNKWKSLWKHNLKACTAVKMVCSSKIQLGSERLQRALKNWK